MSSPCLTLHECCLSSTHTLSYMIYPLYKCQSKTPTSFSLSWPIPYFLHLILIMFLMLLICTHHTQYMKSHPHLCLPIYVSLLKMNSKLNYLVSYFGFCDVYNGRICYSKFLQGGYPSVHHPLLEEVKVKKTLFKFQGKGKKSRQTALASNCLWVACWSLLWGRALAMAVSLELLGGQRSQVSVDRSLLLLTVLMKMPTERIFTKGF